MLLLRAIGSAVTGRRVSQTWRTSGAALSLSLSLSLSMSLSLCVSSHLSTWLSRRETWGTRAIVAFFSIELTVKRGSVVLLKASEERACFCRKRRGGLLLLKQVWSVVLRCCQALYYLVSQHWTLWYALSIYRTVYVIVVALEADFSFFFSLRGMKGT